MKPTKYEANYNKINWASSRSEKKSTSKKTKDSKPFNIIVKKFSTRNYATNI